MATLRTNTDKVQGEKNIIPKTKTKKEEVKIINLTNCDVTASKLKKYEIWRGCFFPWYQWSIRNWEFYRWFYAACE